MIKERLDWDSYFMNIAKEVSKRGTCLRRYFGAVVVKDNTIVSTGYTGAPRGTPNCNGNLGYCYRNNIGAAPGTRYEMCRSVHAEQNALLNGGRETVFGGTIYIHGETPEGDLLSSSEPCMMCWRFIINAGIKRVVVDSVEGLKEFSVEERVKKLSENPDLEFNSGYGFEK